MQFNQFFNEKMLLEPHGENDIVYTTEYYILQELLGIDRKIPEFLQKLIRIRIALKSQVKEPMFLEAIQGEPYSHDNMTSFLCLSKLMCFTYHKKFFYRYWWRRIHPRDIIFYIWLTGNIFSYIAYLFLWIPSLIMILDIAFDRHKVIDGNKVLATDGKLLTWIRINSTSMPITKYLCDKIMKLRNRRWSDFFALYFKADHPNVILSKQLDK